VENMPTFQKLDRLEAERQALRRSLVDRLTRVLAKELSLSEIKFVWNYPSNAILVESFERARTETKR
jgi:hypothetical protein